jgi:hypothetical protein
VRGRLRLSRLLLACICRAMYSSSGATTCSVPDTPAPAGACVLTSPALFSLSLAYTAALAACLRLLLLTYSS